MNDETIMIGDFGAATQFEKNSATYVGTIAYMAPEMTVAAQTQGVYGSKVDLWSIGVSYYKLLFGHFPFKSNDNINNDIHENSGDKLKFHLDKNPISIYSQDILKKLLQEDPEKRISWTDFFNHALFTCSEEDLKSKDPEDL